jgi:hypothetical protein
VGVGCVINKPPASIDDIVDGWQVIKYSTPGVVQTGTWPNNPPFDSNLSGQFSLKWDLQYLYVAVKVIDDVRQTPSTDLTRDDSIELFFDSNHMLTDTYQTGDDFQLIYSAQANHKDERFDKTSVTWTAGENNAWTYYPSNNNWSLFARIPWSAIGGTPSGGRVIGFDIQLDDNDAGQNGRDRALLWQDNSNGMCSTPNPPLPPPWPWACPLVFGAIELMGS